MAEPAYNINPCDRHNPPLVPYYFFNGEYHILECPYCNIGFGYKDINQLIERWNNERPIMPRVRLWSQSKITGIEVVGEWCNAAEVITTKDRYQVQFTDYDWWLEYESEA